MMNRRDALKAAAATAAGIALTAPEAKPAAPAGRVKQSVARWCFASVPMEQFCKQCADWGITGMDLVGPNEWEVCRKYGITPAMVGGPGGFGRSTTPGRRFGPASGWAHADEHDQLEKTAKESIDRASSAKVPNVISLFGDRKGMSDAQGIENCVKGLNRIKHYAEDKGVNIAIELLNSKVDHPDYIGNHTAFGVEVCKQVNSPKITLLYDIYHMQIMEGDVIQTIRDNIKYISHFHTAGVPGRHQLDDTQEVNWRGVAKAIADLNFTGWMAHEFVPDTKDPMAALKQAIDLCNV